MHAGNAEQWMTVGYALMALAPLPLVLLGVSFFLSRQWVRYLGKPGVATVVSAEPVATLPTPITQIDLSIVPDGEPEWVKIRARVRWNSREADPAELVPGFELPVRYRMSRPIVVMPDARRP